MKYKTPDVFNGSQTENVEALDATNDGISASAIHEAIAAKRQNEWNFPPTSASQLPDELEDEWLRYTQGGHTD